MHLSNFNAIINNNNYYMLFHIQYTNRLKLNEIMCRCRPFYPLNNRIKMMILANFTANLSSEVASQVIHVHQNGKLWNRRWEWKTKKTKIQLGWFWCTMQWTCVQCALERTKCWSISMNPVTNVKRIASLHMTLLKSSSFPQRHFQCNQPSGSCTRTHCIYHFM